MALMQATLILLAVKQCSRFKPSRYIVEFSVELVLFDSRPMIKQVYVRKKGDVPAELGTLRVLGFDYKL
ncbi:hypothetical protein GmHk_06G015885 [Glycine max]|nr:hypothetical protein GmHk_06G015885 [Glycine max]